ncbi:MAG: hypothetical protein PHO10_08940 [Gemmiger sp.]|nr:hypothetical protein [Gemmiger sp.]
MMGTLKEKAVQAANKWLGPSTLDEMQELKTLKIYRNGMIFTWLALMVAIVAQLLAGARLPQIAGEWLIFMAVDIYILGAMIKAGIWSTRRKLKADWPTSLWASAIASVSTLAFGWATSGTLWGGLLTAAITLVLCLVCFAILLQVYKIRQKKLEQEPEEKNDGE